MRTTHAFHPTSFDRLEAREVLSHWTLFTAHVVRPMPARTVAPVAAVAPVHVTASPVANVTPAHVTPASNAPVDVSTVVTDMQNMGGPLTDISIASLNGATAAQLAASFPTIRFQGNSVGVSLRARTDASALAAELETLGASIVTTSPAYLTVEAYVPVSQLLAVAQLDQTLYGAPMYKPVLSGPGRFGAIFL